MCRLREVNLVFDKLTCGVDLCGTGRAFEKRKKGGRKLGGQRVQVNRWPHHQVIHLPDGRWRLDNEYASYTTCPDHEENTAPYLKGIVIEPCPQCCSKLDGN